MADWALDHVVIVTSDLETDIKDFEKNLKCEPKLGGVHEKWGTRNAVVGVCNSKAYVELLGPDNSKPDSLGNELLNKHKPGLNLTPYHFAIRTSNLEGVRAKAKAAGMEPREIQEMSRTTPDGKVLKWKYVFIKGHGLGGLVPFFIDWEGAHPTDSFSKEPSDCCLSVEVVVAGPSEHLATVKKLLDGTAGVSFEEHDTPALYFPVGISEMEGGLITMRGYQPEGIDFEESKTRIFEWTAH
eukprot:Nitzschia sp. Nitz4//scaffold241_size29735//3519//4241//NITZ4_008024-RA/size29735-processed-gene-0.6-mRNA-1//-1//CDS//3329543769//8495//frame0